MSGQITVPEPTAEEKAYFNKLQAAGPNTAVGGGFGFATTVLLVKRMQNKAVGAALGAFVGITSFGVGRALDMQANVQHEMETGAFERDFPEGAWKEMMRASAQGRAPDPAVMEHYSGPPAYQTIEQAQSPQYQSYANLNGQQQGAPVEQAPVEQPVAIPIQSSAQAQQYQSYADLASIQRQPTTAPIDLASPVAPSQSEHPVDLPPLPPMDQTHQPTTKRYNKYGDEIHE